MLLVQETLQNLVLFFPSLYWFINFDPPQKITFPYCLPTFVICPKNLKALAVLGWRFNLRD